jgi:hypothetical protein
LAFDQHDTGRLFIGISILNPDDEGEKYASEVRKVNLFPKGGTQNCTFTEICRQQLEA